MLKQQGRKAPEKARKKGKFDSGKVMHRVVGGLEQMCLFLVQQGHNNEYRNPYRYPMKQLVATFEKTQKTYNHSLANSSIAHQAAIIGTNSEEGGKYFQQYINKLVGS